MIVYVPTQAVASEKSGVRDQSLSSSQQPRGAVATPCRSETACPVPQTPHETAPPLDHLEIPYDGDQNAPFPVAGVLRLSENAINLRMRRVFQPSVKTGEFRVAENIRKMYADKKGKPKLLQIFQSCGFDPDRVDEQIHALFQSMIYFSMIYIYI